MADYRAIVVKLSRTGYLLLGNLMRFSDEWFFIRLKLHKERSVSCSGFSPIFFLSLALVLSSSLLESAKHRRLNFDLSSALCGHTNKDVLLFLFALESRR